MTSGRTASVRAAREEVLCRQFGQLRKKRKKNRKNTREEKKLIEILQSGGFGKTPQTTPIGGNPRWAKQKSCELVISLYFSLWSLFSAVDVSRWRCCRPIADTHVPEVCVKPPRSQRRRFFPTCSVFFYRFSPFLFYFSRQ